MSVCVPEIGSVKVDISFGGMWYVVVNSDQLGLHIRPENGAKLARLGEMIKVSTREQCPVEHPTMDYTGPDILVWTQGSGKQSRNKDCGNRIAH